MERITATFEDDIAQKIRQRAMDNSNQSLSQCLRELVELGLVSEGSAKEKYGETGATEALTEIKRLLKASMNWTLESRYIARYLVTVHPKIDKEKQEEILKNYPQKAGSDVENIINQLT